MASIHRRPGSKIYTAAWTDAGGRRLKRSTGTTEKRKALEIASIYEKESRAKRTVIQTRRVLADIYRSLAGEDLPMKTVREYFTGFIDRKKPEVSSATLAYYRGTAKRFLKWMGAKADADISEVTKQRIVEFRNFIAATTSPTTTNNVLKGTKAFFAAAKKDGFLLDDPAVDVECVRDRTEATRRPFSMDELRSLLAAADDEWRSMIFFGLYSGQRLGDLAALTWGSLDLEKNQIDITTKKTGRRQVIPIPPPLREHIRTLQPGAAKDPVHPRSARIVGKTGRSGVLSKLFGELLSQADLRPDGVQVKQGAARVVYELSFHSLRHTSTSILKAAGVPSSVVMSFIGHSTVDVSQNYTHIDMDAMEKAAAAFPEL